MKSGTPFKRSVRVAERIRLELSELLLRGEVRDPRAAGAMVSRVEVTDDLSLARVYVRLLETDPSAKRQRDLVLALEGARGYLRREVGQRLTGKRTPDLRFAWDAGVEHSQRVAGILDELRSTGEFDDKEVDDKEVEPEADS
ncbi:MAG: 30S ribosome-binding factor RbfA [Deltaproteobacteria bacterium]|nr:MAG: 30S ribosome-binding factor RbfA [Deltaproteobacteria bacterium]